MKKYNEKMIVRDGKMIYAISLADKNNKGSDRTHILIDNGKVYFTNSWYSDSLEFDFNDDAHKIAKEIFVSQLQTTIRNKILELKQLESLFKELDMQNYLGTTLSDNQMFLTDVKELIEENAKEIDAVKKQIANAEERIIDVEEIKEISAKTVEESVKPIARKNIKEG